MTNLIIGNWKSNGSIEINKLWLKDFLAHINDDAISETAICPPYVYLDQMINLCSQKSISIGAQDVDYGEGARTGAVSINACIDMGCDFSIIGHSERRELFKENNNDVRLKLKCAQKSGLKIVMCIGEPIEEYNAGTTKPFLEQQLVEALGSIELTTDLIVAYEPIWAIGTGLVPTEKEIDEAIGSIREIFKKPIKVLYGGSVKASNAQILLDNTDINGLLVGGASLNAQEFAKIAQLC